MSNVIETLRNSVKETIKSLGLTNKDVSLSVRYEGYSKVIKAKIKSENVNISSLFTALEAFEKYQTCPHTGEILSGGNTFVSIYDTNNNYVNL